MLTAFVVALMMKDMNRHTNSWAKFGGAKKMITRESAADAATRTEQNPKENSSTEALKHIREDLKTLRSADQTVGAEMNKVSIVCEPPPVTPRCHPVEVPADPYKVTIAMVDLNQSSRQLQMELDALQASIGSKSKKFAVDFQTMWKQAQNLNTEIENLNSLSKFDTLRTHEYDKDKILAETDKIDKLAREMERTQKQMEKD